MPPGQLKETTMNPETRTLLKIVLPEEEKPSNPKRAANGTADLVERLMGRKPEARLKFIQQRAETVEYVDI